MKKCFVTLIALALLLGACRYHEGSMSTNAAITAKSEIVAVGSGAAETQHVFGIGGLNQETLIKKAKHSLYLNFPLKKGQAYANMSVDISRSFYPLIALPIVVVNNVVVSADIVNLDPENVGEELQPYFKTLQESKPPIAAEKAMIYENSAEISWIQRNDSMMFCQSYNCEKVFVRNIFSVDKVVVINQEGKAKKEKISKLYVFEKGVTVPDQIYQVGDSLETEAFGYKTKGEVVGINPYGVLVFVGGPLLKLDNEMLKSVE